MPCGTIFKCLLFFKMTGTALGNYSQHPLTWASQYWSVFLSLGPFLPGEACPVGGQGLEYSSPDPVLTVSPTGAFPLTDRKGRKILSPMFLASVLQVCWAGSQASQPCVCP